MPKVSDIVQLTINVSSSAITRKGFNSLLCIGDESNFESGFTEHEVRKYTSYDDVAADADIKDGDVKNQALVAFGQKPSIPTLYISRSDAGSPVAQVGDLVFDAALVTGNSIAITKNGNPIAGSPVAFDTDNTTTLANIATAIQAEPDVVTAVSDGTDTIEITGAVAGQTFSIGATVTGGASQAVATFTVTTEAVASLTTSDLDAILQNNNKWFGLCTTYTDPGSKSTAAAFCAANNRWFSGRQVNFTIFQNLNTGFAAQHYSSSIDPIAKFLDVAIASKILAQIPGTYTVAYQGLELVATEESLTPTQEQTLRDNNINQYSPIADIDLTYNGVASNGGFIDTYIGVAYLQARIEEDVFAQMAAVQKVPYTNAGTGLVTSAVQNRLNQSVTEGFLTNDPAPVTTAPLVSEISAPDKSNRLLPDVKFQAETSGAVHTVQIQGTIVA